MLNCNLVFYSIKDALPVIPEGYRGVSVIIVCYDPVYDEINPGKGYDIYEAHYFKLSDVDYKRYPHYVKNNIKEDCWGEYGPVLDNIVMWAYMPKMVSGEFI